MGRWKPRPETMAARILIALEDGPATDAELAVRLDTEHQSVNQAARKLADAGYVHRTAERPIRTVLADAPALSEAPTSLTLPDDDPWTAWLVDHLERLAERRPIFHSERDFQVALAMQLAQSEGVYPRLEIRPRRDENAYLDLMVRHDGRKIGLELKYVTAALEHEIEGEPYVLRDHSAGDVRRYDTVKDLVRIEDWVRSGFLDQGFVVLLTNRLGLTRPGRGGSISEAFRLHEGAVLEGSRAWAERAGEGTTDGRSEPLVLHGRYVCRWRRYRRVDDVPRGDFRLLLLSVAASRPSPG